jgi:RNA polymerase sigma-70 factor, ECF subfamily
VDRDRFEAEALPHLKRLYGTAYRMTGNAADAEDLVQEALLRAFRGFDRFRAGSNIRAWLYTILHRVRTDTFQEGLVWGGEAVERALLRVPEVFREAVLLRDVEELSYAEIATALEVPQGTVMSRISRGRALLRRALAESRS